MRGARSFWSGGAGRFTPPRWQLGSLPVGRYYATDHPAADHGAQLVLLVVFEDAVAPAHFLRVAREEVVRTGVDLPLWTASPNDLEVTGSLGIAWRNPVGQAFDHALLGSANRKPTYTSTSSSSPPTTPGRDAHSLRQHTVSRRLCGPQEVVPLLCK